MFDTVTTFLALFFTGFFLGAWALKTYAVYATKKRFEEARTRLGFSEADIEAIQNEMRGNEERVDLIRNAMLRANQEFNELLAMNMAGFFKEYERANGRFPTATELDKAIARIGVVSMEQVVQEVSATA